MSIFSKLQFPLPESSPTFSRVDKLIEIMHHKRLEIEAVIPRMQKLKAAALERNEFRGFRSALDRDSDHLSVIAEVKKASPSAGIIDPNFDPVRQARMYINGGANCISILTDEKYFKGHLSFLARIAQESPIPCLRKDFMVHEVQIYEAVVSGADAILLIVAGLTDEELKKLYDIARIFQLDVLVEVHNLAEMERALNLGADLIGINNRNLKTFTTDLGTTEQLVDEVPENVILVSESGIKTPADGQRILNAGANAILVGESLMRANNPAEDIQAYLNLVDLGGAAIEA